ncbi:AAA family ATPase [Acidobacteriota bacterium]
MKQPTEMDREPRAMVTVRKETDSFVIPETRLSSISDTLRRLQDNVRKVIRGKDEIIELAIVGLCARGHILIEDIPGVGKTTLARALARSINCTFKRIQFTSDLLPSDVVGVSIYQNSSEDFQFKAGPIFANIVLADEINRATPKTQSALLEAMNERQVTYDNHTYKLPSPFLVMATQNPFDHHGTFPLPESQMDRFFMRIEMGYPPEGAEKSIMRYQDSFDMVDELEPVLDKEEILEIQEEVFRVRVDESLVDYMMRIITASRDSQRTRLGASPRAAQVLYRASQAYALVSGRDHCLPDDIKRIAIEVLAHRVMPAGSSSPHGLGREESKELISGLLDTVEIPI